MKRTKIVCTIGPASEKPVTLEAMIRAGMNVARLNMSHNTWPWHAGVIKRIRAAAKKVGEPVAVLLDLQGPKARLGKLKVEGLRLKVGERVVFTTGRQGLSFVRKDSPWRIPIAVPNFHKYVKKGAHLLIADGTIECVVESVRGQDIYAKVTLDGELQSQKGIAIQGISLPLPPLTSKDKQDVKWAAVQDVDFVALSFVKKAGDVVALRRLLTPGRHFDRAARRVEKSHTVLGARSRNSARDDHNLAIIVKIETREAVQNFEEILAEADGIMVARGDLALATSPEEVPLIQKEIIEKCRRGAKPVIVATEMLASMERSPRPTRAEASDVANAVIDHADALMLSGETGNGAFPLQAVATMARLAARTEASRFDDLSIGGEIKHMHGAASPKGRASLAHFGGREEEVALLAAVRARTAGARAIAAGSLTGHTGRLLSRYRSEVELLIGSPFPEVMRQLNLSWGVRPFLMPKARSREALLKGLLNQAKRGGFKKGATVVLVGSERLASHGQSFVSLRIL